jgi:hypothetical protein
MYVQGTLEGTRAIIMAILWRILFKKSKAKEQWTFRKNACKFKTILK